jgi:hypothetical protein
MRTQQQVVFTIAVVAQRAHVAGDHSTQLVVLHMYVVQITELRHPGNGAVKGRASATRLRVNPYVLQ